MFLLYNDDDEFDRQFNISDATATATVVVLTIAVQYDLKAKLEKR